MKKLLVVLMALGMSLGVWGEASAAEFPRGDSPWWATSYEESGTGTLLHLRPRRHDKASAWTVDRFPSVPGAGDVVLLTIHHGGASVSLAVRADDGSSLNVCWQYHPRRGDPALGQECGG